MGAACIALSFPLNNGHIGRAGLFVALVAEVVTARDLARNVVARITRIIALYEEDVQLDRNAPECLVSDLSRARRLRDTARRARRTLP